MKKLDLKKELKHLYSPSPKEPVLVDVPDMNFLMVDGAGDPNTAQEYKDSIEVLYAMSYTLKFMVKKENPEHDYMVMPIEGLWWGDDPNFLLVGEKDTWNWTSMIMQPEFVTEKHVAGAVEQVKEKKDPVALPKCRFEAFHEGLSAQIMHIGPYAEEEPTIKRLHAFIEEQGHRPRGKHHEIYLSDPRRAAPEKLKTVVRQPVE